MLIEQRFAVTVKSPDSIPRGIFFSDKYTLNKIAAIRTAIILGWLLAKKYPEVADLYSETKGPNRYDDIAKLYIPEIAHENQDFARAVVGYAVRSINPELAQQEVTSRHQPESLKKQTREAGSDQFRDHQRKSAGIFHEKGGVDNGVIVRASNKIRWSEEEKQIVLEYLVHLPEFQHQNGSFIGTPDYALIAHTLNELYHESEEVRNANSVASFVRDTRKKTKR